MSAKGHAQMIAVVCQSIVVCYNTWVQLSLRTSTSGTSHKLVEFPRRARAAPRSPALRKKQAPARFHSGVAGNGARGTRGIALPQIRRLSQRIPNISSQHDTCTLLDQQLRSQ